MKFQRAKRIAFSAALGLTAFAAFNHTAFAADGDVIVSTNPLLVRVGLNGSKITIPTTVLAPTGVATDQLGNIFVADALSNSIVKIDAAGTQTTVTTGLNNPQALLREPNGNLLVANTGDNTVVEVAPNGSKTTIASNLSNPSGLALDRLGNVLISNAGSNSIVKVASDGTKSTVVSAGLNAPQGIAVDALGNIFVADSGSNSILKVNALGAVSSVLSTGLSSPQDVSLDGLGNLRVADLGSNALKIVAPDGTVSNGASNLTAPNYMASSSPVHELLNISTRGYVNTGDSILIAGFILRGTATSGVGSTETLVRVLGPSLSAQNVPNTLQDPTLELHDSSGALIATNDNWKDSQQSDISATGLAPSDDRESAIDAVLPDGAYTAIVRGANNTVGNALVEVYKVQ